MKTVYPPQTKFAGGIKTKFAGGYKNWLFARKELTLKAPIMTAADDNFCDTFPNFGKKRYDIS